MSNKGASPGSEEFRKNRDQIKNDAEQVIREKCRELVEDEDVDQDVFGWPSNKLRVLIGIPRSSWYNYAPHILLDQDFESISYTEQKGLKIHAEDFLQESE